MSGLNAAKTLFLAVCLLMLGGHVRAQDATPTPWPSLAEQVGFDDTVLRYFEEQGDHYFFDDQLWKAFGHHYRLITVLGTPNPTNADGAVLLYQMDGSTPSLVWKRDFSQIGYAPVVRSFDIDEVHAPAPGDWNGDGNIEFAVLAISHCMGGSDCSILYIYRLKPDGMVVSALDHVIPPGYIVYDIDSDLNQSPLLKLYSVTEQEADGLPHYSECGAVDIRFYGWRDGVLRDASADYPHKYSDLIGCNVFEFETTDNPAVEIHNALTLLKTFDVLGKRDAGWTLVQNLLAQAKQEGRLLDDPFRDKFMTAMKKLYENGQPFVSPYLLASYDYYDEANFAQ